MQRAWLQVIEAGVADGSFRDDIPSRVFYRLIRDAVWLSIRWHRPGGPYSTQQLAEDVTSLFLHGFATSPGRQTPTQPAVKKANGSVEAARVRAKKA